MTVLKLESRPFIPSHLLLPQSRSWIFLYIPPFPLPSRNFFSLVDFIHYSENQTYTKILPIWLPPNLNNLYSASLFIYLMSLIIASFLRKNFEISNNKRGHITPPTLRKTFTRGYDSNIAVGAGKYSTSKCSFQLIWTTRNLLKTKYTTRYHHSILLLLVPIKKYFERTNS